MKTPDIFTTLFLVLLSFTAIGQSRTLNFPKETEYVMEMPQPDSLWIFILAGQSNMAGRGYVEPQDTLFNKRILTIDKTGKWIYAKEPLHFYEPKMAGLDCGLSFGHELLQTVPSHITLAILPCAVGGSAIEQWLNDDIFRGVQLLSNFENKVDLAKKRGVIKGILWHQGESNASAERIPSYAENLQKLTQQFRDLAGNDSLPIILGQLGRYAEPREKRKRWKTINDVIKEFADSDPNIGVISSKGLKEKGDKVHFDGPSQRKMGRRFAKEYLKTIQ